MSVTTEFDAFPIPVVHQADLLGSAYLTGTPISIAATGSTTTDAAALTAIISRVTAANAVKGVRLPADVPGVVRVVVNAGADVLLIYPPTGGTINGGSVDAAVTLAAGLKLDFLTSSALTVRSGGTAAGAAASPVTSAEVTFTETTGAGVYTGSVSVPAGATIHDVIVNGVALWTATTSATLKVGDVAVDDGYFTGVNLKATDLLAGESLSFALAGGKAGSYIANSQVSPRYSATSRVVSGIVTTVGAAGSAGRTRMTVLYSLNVPTSATKV